VVQIAGGLEVTETAREISFCTYTILQDDLMWWRMRRRQAVREQSHGAFGPLRAVLRRDAARDRGRFNVGTLCVLDRSPRGLAAEHADALRILSRQVMTQLELRRHLVELAQSIQDHHLIEDRLGLRRRFIRRWSRRCRNIFSARICKAGLLLRTAFCSLIGKPLGEVLGKTDFDFFPAEMAAKYHRDDARVINTLENLDTVEAHRAPSGEKMSFTCSRPRFTTRSGDHWHAGDFLGRDEPEETEEALAYERIYCGLLDNIPDAFISRTSNRASSGAATQCPSPGLEERRK